MNTPCTKASSSPIITSAGLRLPAGKPSSVSPAPYISSGVQVNGTPLLNPRAAPTPGRWLTPNCEVMEPREWPASPAGCPLTRPVNKPQKFRAALVAPIVSRAARQTAASSPSSRTVCSTSPTSSTRWRNRLRIIVVVRSMPPGISGESGPPPNIRR